ncbi:MAG: glycosyltransferase [Elusimicrobia bacterium]|nr:glycosyltransferase [Elusimicrobiota bacterium]
MNPDAQKNISDTIGVLGSRKDVSFFGLEGTDRIIDLERFRSFSDQKSVRLVADSLLSENKISGPIHAALTGPGKMPDFLGIESIPLYEKNIDSYRESMPRLTEIRAVVDRFSENIALQKGKTYGKELRGFDQIVSSYREGGRFGDYLKALVSFSLKKSDPAIFDFLRVLDMETSLNISEIERERAILLNQLTSTLLPEQLRALETACVEVRLGRISSADFYRFLANVCFKAGVPLSKFPYMDHYVRYVLLADGISTDDLYRAVAQAEKDVYAQLASTKEEHTLYRQDRFIHLTSKLVEFSLTPEEWEEYQIVKGEHLLSGFPLQELITFENFYRFADARNETMVTNLLSSIGSHPVTLSHVPQIPVLITGGFHSEGISKRLTQAGFAVANFVPRIEKIDTPEGASSLSVFSQGKTPLSHLFAGEKLFLAPNPVEETITELEAPAKIVAAGILSGFPVREGFSRLAGPKVYKKVTDIVQDLARGGAILRIQFSRGWEYVVQVKPLPDNGMTFLAESKKRALNPVELFREQLFVLPAVSATILAFLIMGVHSPWAIPVAFATGFGGLWGTRKFFLDRHPDSLALKYGVSLSEYKGIVEKGYWLFGLGTVVAVLLSLGSGSSIDAVRLIELLFYQGVLSGMGSHALFNLLSPVPAMGVSMAVEGTIERLSVYVGEWRHSVIRDPQQKVSAHVEVSASPQEDQRIVIELPAAQAAVALPARAEKPWIWNILSLSPVQREGGFRGVEIALLAKDQKTITLDLAHTLMLNVVSLRMALYYGHNIGEEEKKFVDYVKNLPSKEFASIEKLMSSPFEEVIIPRIRSQVDVQGKLQQVEILKTTFDGRNHYRLGIDIPDTCHATLTPEGNLLVEGIQSVEIRLRIDSDVEPLIPMPFHKIFSAKALRVMNRDPFFRESAVRFAALVYENKLLAGSWMYPSYFGRDTLVAARLMWPALTTEAKKVVIQSVLNHLGKFAIEGVPLMDGWVAVSDERQGELLFHETVVEFNHLADRGNSKSAADLLSRVLSGPRQAFEYHVLDGNALFTGLLAKFLREMGPTERQRFLSIQNERGESNLDSILAHAHLLLNLTQPYVKAFQSFRDLHPGHSLEELKLLPGFHSLARNLIRLQPDAKGQESIGNWRDSPPALGWGKYPADINAFLIPRALAALDEVFDFLGRNNPHVRDRLEEKNWPSIRAALTERAILGSARDAWATAHEHFQVHLSKEDVRQRLSRYLAWGGHSFEDRRRLGRRLLAPGISVQDFVGGDGDPSWLKNGFSFTAIALDDRVRPVPIVNSDEVFSLVDQNLSISDTRRLLQFWTRPYPIGLGTEAGPLISHPVLTDDEHLWRSLDQRSYHGSVVWGWVTASLGLGWARQLKVAEKASDREKILQMFGDFLSLRNVLGPLALSEVWTWALQEDGAMLPVDLIHGSEGSRAGQPAVPIQLWSASAFPLDPLVREAMGILQRKTRTLRTDPEKDGVWQRLNKRVRLPSRLIEKWQLLKEDARLFRGDRRTRIPRYLKLLEDISARGPPGGIRVAFLHYTAPPRVSGVDIVMTEQARWLARMGIHVRVVAGNRSNEFDSVPRLDFVPLEGLAKMEEGEIAQHLERVFAQEDIVVLHNVMSVPNNIALTSSLHRYMARHPEKHFIIFVHNAMEREEPHYPYSLMNPTLDWPQVTYVTVSKAYREVISQSYPRAPPFQVINPALWPYNPDTLSSEAASDFSQQGLFNQDVVMVLPTRVDWNKDIPKALQITEAVARRRLKTKLILMIPGVSSFAELVKETRANRGVAAADWLENSLRHVVERHVVFLDATKIEGFREHRQYVVDVVALSDVLLMPSRMESFGMPAIEAAAVRTVVAATSLDPHLETLGKGGSPLFSIEESPKVIADRILVYLERHSPRDLGTLQRKVIERFEWDRVMADQFVPVLESAVQSLPRMGTAINFFQTGDVVRAYEQVDHAFHALAKAPHAWQSIVGEKGMKEIGGIIERYRSRDLIGETPELARLRRLFIEPALALLAQRFSSEEDKIAGWLEEINRVIGAVDLLVGDSRHTIALNTLGNFQREAGRLQDSRVAYEESRRIDPVNQDALSGLGILDSHSRETKNGNGGGVNYNRAGGMMFWLRDLWNRSLPESWRMTELQWHQYAFLTEGVLSLLFGGIVSVVWALSTGELAPISSLFEYSVLAGFAGGHLLDLLGPHRERALPNVRTAFFIVVVSVIPWLGGFSIQSALVFFFVTHAVVNTIHRIFFPRALIFFESLSEPVNQDPILTPGSAGVLYSVAVAAHDRREFVEMDAVRNFNEWMPRPVSLDIESIDSRGIRALREVGGGIHLSRGKEEMKNALATLFSEGDIPPPDIASALRIIGAVGSGQRLVEGKSHSTPVFLRVLAGPDLPNLNRLLEAQAEATALAVKQGVSTPQLLLSAGDEEAQGVLVRLGVLPQGVSVLPSSRGTSGTVSAPLLDNGFRMWEKNFLGGKGPLFLVVGLPLGYPIAGMGGLEENSIVKNALETLFRLLEELRPTPEDFSLWLEMAVLVARQA